MICLCSQCLTLESCRANTYTEREVLNPRGLQRVNYLGAKPKKPKPGVFDVPDWKQDPA